MNYKEYRIRRQYKFIFIILSLLILIAFAIASFIEYKTTNEFAGTYIVNGLLILALPVIGSLFFIVGVHQWINDGEDLKKEYWSKTPWGGLAVAAVMIFNIIGGPALILCPTLIVILTDPTSIIPYMIGIPILAISVIIAVTTILIHGGSKLVQKTAFGRKITYWRNIWQAKIFEEE